MTKTTHIHKLKRLKYKSGNSIFFCALPDCNFKTNTSLALGKRSICWRCGESFIINEYSLRLAKPHCESCHKPKVDKIEGETTLPNGVVISQQSLIERLQQTIQSKQTEQEDEI